MKPFKITELFAWVIEDQDGEDGIPAIQTSIGPMPLIGADGVRIQSLRAAALLIVKELGRPARLCKFSNMEVLEVLEPPVLNKERLLS